MVYFTPAFEAMEKDIEGYVETMMEELNEGFENTDLNIKGELHCIAPVNVDDKASSGVVLSRFRNAFGMCLVYTFPILINIRWFQEFFCEEVKNDLKLYSLS